MELPATAFIAAGAVLAALIAGFFSFLNMVSAKESRVSEFRQQWIDDLRTETADLYAAVQELIYLMGRSVDPDDHSAARDWENAYVSAVRRSRTNFTKVLLRFNPSDVNEKKGSPEAEIVAKVLAANDAFSNANFSEGADHISSARDATAKLLKSEWERVKAGEPTYRRVRTAAWVVLIVGIACFLGSVGVLLWLSISQG